MSAPARFAKLKGAATTALIIAFVIGFENAIYEWGYYRGFSRGSVVMRDAIMCVMERTASIQPYKYCAEQSREAGQ